MTLYNGRNKIIKSFVDRNIKLSKYLRNAKSEPKEYDGVQKSEQKFDESIGKKVKLRIQKADDKKDETGDEQIDTTNMPDLKTEESAEQRRKTKEQGLKILTPEQMLTRLPISLV